MQLGSKGVTWFAREIVGGIHDVKTLGVGQRVTQNGITCVQPNSNELTCTNAVGGFTISGMSHNITLKEGTPLTAPPAKKPAVNSYTDVNPVNYFGRSKTPLFDYHNGGKAMGWCALETDTVWCNMGNTKGENTVKMTDHSVQTMNGEGPTEPNLKKLQAGERISWGQTSCYRPDSNSIVCTAGPNMIELVGPDYKLKINGGPFQN